ncbi:MAG: hypothetical protein K2N03_08550, partial [Muribaculaceae bacterium]|nr:hypothetical protein [Muribaculaceae bacterium]
DSIPANLTPSLFQTNLLTDGTWSTPTPLPQEVNDITPMLPFLTNDGSLLYFASDNPEESLGGYDLFVASRDPSDDSYLEPSNLGMPFNSPYNDLMLALDEENGVGWWASDRSRIPGMITIYIYVIPKERMEISEQDDAVALASLNDFRLTWPEDMETLSPEYEELLEKIKEIGLDEEVEAEDFRLPMPGGKVYKLFSDFRNPASPDIMQQYLDLETVQIDELDELSSLRREYSRNRTDSSVRSRIRALEKTTEHRDTQMRHLLSNIYRLETGN